MLAFTGLRELLYVTYNTTGGWSLQEVHLYVLDEAPNERLPPGQAPYQAENLSPGTTEYTFTVPLDDLEAVCGETELWLQAHAAVVRIVDGTVVQGETAYGGDITEPDQGSWYGNIAYVVQCCEEPPPPPPGECQEETAWGGASEGGGSAWWYYYDTAGPVTQSIYAGQELTDGTVTCDGGQLSIDLGSWSLQDVEEPVKVQCYEEGQLPTSKPTPGRFTTYKGEALTIPGFDCSECSYIAIHLDVELCEGE
jgi:hypothetical protein